MKLMSKRIRLYGRTRAAASLLLTRRRGRTPRKAERIAAGIEAGASRRG